MEVVERGRMCKATGSWRPQYEFDRVSVVPQVVALLHLLKGFEGRAHGAAFRGSV
jgi:hypothetical protein